MEVRIRYSNTDCTGRIFFPKYFEYFDDATIEFFREKGIVFDSFGKFILDNKIADELLAVGECSCRFLSEAFFDDIVEIKLEIKELSEKKIIFHVVCFNKTEKNICAEGYIIFICISQKTKKTTKIPYEILKRLNNPNSKTNF